MCDQKVNLPLNMQFKYAAFGLHSTGNQEKGVKDTTNLQYASKLHIDLSNILLFNHIGLEFSEVE